MHGVVVQHCHHSHATPLASGPGVRVEAWFLVSAARLGLGACLGLRVRVAVATDRGAGSVLRLCTADATHATAAQPPKRLPTCQYA